MSFPQAKGLKVQQAEFTGFVTEVGLAGKVNLARAGSRATAAGRLAWGKGLLACADSQGSLDSIGDLARLAGVKNIDARGVKYDGLLTVAGGRFQAGGTLQAASARANSEHISGAVASFSFDSKLGSAVQVHRLKYQGGDVKGRLVVSPKGGQLQGGFELATSQASSIANRFLPKSARYAGPLKATAIVEGDLKHLTAQFQGSAAGSLALPDHKAVALDDLFARGSLGKDGVARFDRVAAKSGGSTLLAYGDLNLPKGRLDVNLDARGVEIQRYWPEASGTGSVAGRLHGEPRGPEFEGAAEAYDATFEGTSTTFVRADVRANPETVRAENLQTLVGSGLLEGQIALQLSDQSLSGTLASSNLQLADIAGAGNDGAVSFKTESIGGTLAHPQATARALVSGALVQNLPINFAHLFVQLNDAKLNISNSWMNLLGGAVLVTGQYDLSKGSGEFQINGHDLELDQASSLATDPDAPRFAGFLKGDAELKIDGSNVSGSLLATAANCSVNQQSLGLGTFSLNARSEFPKHSAVEISPEDQGAPYEKSPSLLDRLVLTGSAQFADQTHFVAIENGSFQAETNSVSADILAKNGSAQELMRGLLPELNDLPPSAKARLYSLDGSITAAAHLGGTLDHPQVTVETANLDQTSLNGVALGNVSASGNWSLDGWKVAKATYANAGATGSVQLEKKPGGSLTGDIDLSGIDLDKLTRAWPDIPHLDGLLATTLVLGGTTDSPTARGSLNITGLRPDGQSDAFALDLSSIDIKQGSAKAQGSFNGLGSTAKLTAFAPVQFPLKDLGATPFEANLEFQPRSIKSLEGLPEALDLTASEGTLSGHLGLTGTFAKPKAVGELRADFERLAFRTPSGKSTTTKTEEWTALNTKLVHSTAELAIDGNAVSLSLLGESSLGGTVQGKGMLTIPDLGDLMSSGNSAEKGGAMEKFLASPVTGSLKWIAVSLSESTKSLKARGSISGDIAVAGSLGAPNISGNLNIDRASASVDAIQAGGAQTRAPSIDPIFNIKVAFAPTTEIDTSQANLKLGGDVKILGSLSSPQSSIDLQVHGGNLKLPTRKVVLNDRGKITGTLSAVGDSHLYVDLHGETHVVAIRSIEAAEPYDVFLTVRGDLLDPNGVDLQASSFPPGLESSEALALLGKTDILKALAVSTPGQSLQSAFNSYAIPSFLGPVTDELALGLRLDYLTFDISAYNQSFVFAGKTLSNGFSLYAQRQLSNASPGSPALFDYRINYRPPISRLIPRRVSFFFGTDQLRPWKLGVSYGFRF